MIENKDLDELKYTIFAGLTVGVGSLVFHFNTGAQLLVQCPFEILRAGNMQLGHGESMDSSPLLFSLINRKIGEASYDSSSTLSLHFDGGEVNNTNVAAASSATGATGGTVSAGQTIPTLSPRYPFTHTT